MLAFPAVSRPVRQTAIAILLSLLAFSFAMEARMARYESPEGYSSDVHASRLIAPDARDLTPGESSPAESMVFLCVSLAIFTATFILAPENRPWNTIQRESLRSSSGFYFSPHIAFRPPPSR